MDKHEQRGHMLAAMEQLGLTNHNITPFSHVVPEYHSVKMEGSKVVKLGREMSIVDATVGRMDLRGELAELAGVEYFEIALNLQFEHPELGKGHIDSDGRVCLVERGLRDAFVWRMASDGGKRWPLGEEAVDPEEINNDVESITEVLDSMWQRLSGPRWTKREEFQDDHTWLTNRMEPVWARGERAFTGDGYLSAIYAFWQTYATERGKPDTAYPFPFCY